MTCLPGRRVVITRCPYIALLFLEGWICKGRAYAFVMPRLTLRNNVLTLCLLDIVGLYLDSEFSDE